ncbi:hypothetical protein GCM10023189_32960 [Nibrella saemangeumensis]|uniref:RHS repeat-associated core domain-containing protein n=1 Tax=Nibrella saemangeumensis TaxID=1084526 RepID=A0ABP8N3N5_9BACT
MHRSRWLCRLLAGLSLAFPLLLRAQTPDRNYVLSRTYKAPGSTEANGNTYAGTPYQVNTELTYFNGLGLPLQQLAAFAGPQGQDLMSRTDYDNYHRPQNSFLPLPVSSNTGQFVNNPDGSYYTNAALVTSPTANYFTQTSYEAAPLNRPTEQKAPGVGTGVRTSYPLNSGYVNRYRSFGADLLQIQGDGSYSPGTLSVIETKDETDRTVRDYKDSDNRLVLRQVMNGGQELNTYYVYDEAGLLRAVLQPQYQDEADLNKWAFLYQYDNRGRLSRKKVPGAGAVSLTYDERDRLTSQVDGNNQSFTYSYDGLNRQTQQHVNGQGLVTTYYDDYNFGPFADFTNELGLTSTEFVGNPRYESRKGQVTGTSVRMLYPDGSYGEWLQTVTYFDSKYRVIQVVRQLQGLGAGAYERISYQRNFIGNVVKERITQAFSSKQYVLERSYEYDQADRLVKLSHSFWENGQLKKQYVHLEQSYNAVGQLQSKRLHNGLHSQQLKYHVRGWLAQLTTSGGPQLSLSLDYQPNGNIGSLSYATPGRSGGMTLNYDGANRLNGAWGSGSFQDHNETGINYDRNGNLTSLDRSRPGLTFDQLRYSYNGNQLHRVEDVSGQGEGFVNGASQDHELGYDGNGNLTKDYNRGYSDNGIRYNALNLVRYVVKGTRALSYSYDGAGVKRQLQTPEGTTLYEGGFEYKGDGTLLRLGLEEGQLIRNADGSYVVHYYLKDHLGNVRAVVDESGATVQETEYYAFGYSVSRSGADKNKYQFLTRELQPETGWMDLQARMYDPVLGKFMTVDPVTDGQEEYSTYQYAHNNPITKNDPDGRYPDGPPTQVSSIAHAALDVAGLIPGAGEIADGVNALLYLAEGNKTDAALSAAAMIPIAGWAATGAKFYKTVDKAVDLAKPGEDLFVGTYNQVRRANIKSGLNSTHTPHHVVQNAISKTTHGKGVTINLSKELHEKTATFKKPTRDVSQAILNNSNNKNSLRTHLAADIKELRNILGTAGYNRSHVNKQLQELIRQNKMNGGFEK